MESASSRLWTCSIEAMRMLLATFLVSAAVAAPVTGDATSVTATSATLNGTAVGATTASFEYGTTTGVRRRGADDDRGGRIGAGHDQRDARTPRTTSGSWPTRASARTRRSRPRRTRRRRACRPSTGATSRATSANISASLNPHGGETTYYFQYGTSDQLRRQARPTRRPAPATGRRPPPWQPPSPGCGRTRATTGGSSPPTPPGPRAGPTRRSRPHGAPTAVSLGAVAQDGPVGQRHQPRRARQRAGLGRPHRRARAAAVPVRRRLQGGRAPRARAATAATCSRSTTSGARPATASSRARRRSSRARSSRPAPRCEPAVSGPQSLSRKRARIEGSIVPAVHAAPCRSSAGSRRAAGRRSAPRPSRPRRRRAHDVPLQGLPRAQGDAALPRGGGAGARRLRARDEPPRCSSAAGRGAADERQLRWVGTGTLRAGVVESRYARQITPSTGRGC